MRKTLGAAGEAKTTLEEIPKKLQGFEEFIDLMKQVILQGTDKYTGAKKDAWETIDILPLLEGKEGYHAYIRQDIVKRLIRLKNQGRERDLVKAAVWLFLYWKDDFYQKESGERNCG